MFHVEFIVDDKYLVSILRTLAEIKVHNLETKPVLNVQKKNGKLAAKNGGGTIAERAAAELTNYQNSKLSRAEIFGIIRGLGDNPSTPNINELLEAKVIRRLPERGQYKILGAK